MKKCIKCGIDKPEDTKHFRLSSWGKTFRSECRECERVARKIYYDSNADKACAAARKWSRENPERRNKIKRDWCRKNPERIRLHHIKAEYGIGETEYQKMLAAQKNKCACCGDVFEKTPNIDHCHKTGAIRNLLCGPCNSGIGHFKDDFFRAIKAASYLRKFLT
jgi:hypothetical protein